MSDNYKNNAGWFLAGLSLGAVVAILYAPKSGRETREAIVTGADDARKHMASLGRDAREHISGWVASGKAIVTGKKPQADTAVDADREAAAEKRSQG